MKTRVLAVVVAVAALSGCGGPAPDPNIQLCRTELAAVLAGPGPKEWPESCLALDDEIRDDVSEEVLGNILGAPVEDDDETEVDD